MHQENKMLYAKSQAYDHPMLNIRVFVHPLKCRVTAEMGKQDVI